MRRAISFNNIEQRKVDRSRANYLFLYYTLFWVCLQSVMRVVVNILSDEIMNGIGIDKMVRGTY